MKIMSKILLITFFLIPTTQCGMFERFAQNISSRLRTETFEDMHHGTVDLETVGTLTENSELDTPLKGSRSLTAGQLAALPFALGAVALGGSIVGSYIAYENVRYAKQLTLLEKIAEDHSGIPCATTKLINNRYDFSKIRPRSKIPELKFIDGKYYRDGLKLPCIARYSLSTGKTVDILWDLHNIKESFDLRNKLFENKKFKMGILELGYSTNYLHDPLLLFKDFSSSFKTTIASINAVDYQGSDHPYTHPVDLLNRQNATIVPAEYSTSLESLIAHLNEGLQFADYLCLDLAYNLCTASDNQMSHSFFKTHLFSKDMLERAKYLQMIVGKSVCVRDKKMVQTILDAALDDQNEGHIFVLIGATHGATTYDPLEEHLGEPQILTLEDLEMESANQ